MGDGVILVDAEARLRFASPNAVSALHRSGVQAYNIGGRLAQAGFDDSVFDRTFTARVPLFEELSHGDMTVLAHTIPLMDGRKISGAVMLLRDITELRRRDRLLVSKDATIREIHHRVKNNLQTISALLRLQSRRIQSSEGKRALSEAERRIRAISMVHETLAKETAPLITFSELVAPLVQIVEDSVQTPEGGVAFSVEGSAGVVPGDMTTSLAVILNELMQNAVDHAFPKDEGVATHGHVAVRLLRMADELTMEVIDDGAGLPEDFSVEDVSGLGLSIVKALVETELGGKLTVERGGSEFFKEREDSILYQPAGPGTTFRVEISLGDQTRTNL